MHAALKIPEIILLIFDALDRNFLVNTSLVCSTWAPFALSTRWRMTQIRLKDLIPRPREPSISAVDMDSPLLASWADLPLFSIKVQNLTIDTDMSHGEAERIKESLRGRAFLPNLRRVLVRYYPPHESIATLILGGSARIEALLLGSPNGGGLQPVEKWVQLLHPNAVRQFQFFIPVPSAPFDLARFHRLRDLEIYDVEEVVTLDYEWWPTLSGLRDLRTLILETKTIIRPPTTLSTITFPLLESLTIELLETGALWLLLHSTMPSLLELITRTQFLKGPEFCELMAHLKQHSPRLVNLSVNVGVDVTFLMGTSIPTALAGFRLQQLDLAGHVDTATVPEDRVTFILQEHWTKMLENLESFSLLVSFLDETEFGKADVPLATEDTLVAILKSANKLKRLAIEVDGFDTHSFLGKLEKEYGRVPALGLHYLKLGVTKANSDYKDIEEDLRSALPGLQNVDLELWYF
ncbi:hypothetical protein FRB99_002271 [Tulasnella sp. 403]|nr:hypothetical protein FRB99_002271 [Tulasnella sp. 403]